MKLFVLNKLILLYLISNLSYVSAQWVTHHNPVTILRFDVSIPSTSLTTNGVVDLPLPSARDKGGTVVSFKVYDVLGREVTTLVNEQLKPGSYEIEFDGTDYPSGVYFYQLTTNNFSETKKMVLMK